MLAGELLVADFPSLSLDDTIQGASKVYMENSVWHLPVVENKKLLGIMPAEIVLSSLGNEGKISDFKRDYISAFTLSSTHGIEVFSLCSKLELSLLPVIDQETNYLGSIPMQELLFKLSQVYSFQQPGGIIELSFGKNDLDISNLTRLVEDSNSRVIFMYMDNDESSDLIRLTIKVSTLDIQRIIATLQRFNYKINYYFPAGNYRDEPDERYGYMMKLFDL